MKIPDDIINLIKDKYIDITEYDYEQNLIYLPYFSIIIFHTCDGTLLTIFNFRKRPSTDDCNI